MNNVGNSHVHMHNTCWQQVWGWLDSLVSLQCHGTWLVSMLVCMMQMTQKILEAEGEGDPVQLDFFLKGNLALEKDPRRKPHSWMPDQVTLHTITTCTRFSKLSLHTSACSCCVTSCFACVSQSACNLADSFLACVTLTTDWLSPCCCNAPGSAQRSHSLEGMSMH